MPKTPLSTSADSQNTHTESASNKVSNQDFSSHAVSDSDTAKSMTSESKPDVQESVSLSSQSQAESLGADSHSKSVSSLKEPLNEEKITDIPQPKVTRSVVSNVQFGKQVLMRPLRRNTSLQMLLRSSLKPSLKKLFTQTLKNWRPR